MLNIPRIENYFKKSSDFPASFFLKLYFFSNNDKMNKLIGL